MLAVWEKIVLHPATTEQNKLIQEHPVLALITLYDASVDRHEKGRGDFSRPSDWTPKYTA